MIRFSDNTLRESKGSFSLTNHIMKEQDGVSFWMIESLVTVTTPMISSTSVLHFWHNGEIHIIETDHPPISDLSDEDIREMAKFVSEYGWSNLIVADRLVQNPKEFEFWLRIYRSGLVKCHTLQKFDEDEMERLSKLIVDDDEDTI